MAGSGDYVITTSVDFEDVYAKSAMFIKDYETALNAEFRTVVMFCLKMAKQFAPKGDNDYVIEDMRDTRRSGKSGLNTKPQSQRAQANFDPATGHGDTRIRKVPGGTLRRALSAVITNVVAEAITGVIGVPDDSPAAKYARMREFGGTVRAVRAKVLRFSPDGKTIIFKPVVHQAPHPYLIPALLLAWPLLVEVPAKAFGAASRLNGLV